MEGKADEQTDRLTQTGHRQTDKRTDIQTDGRTDKQTHVQTDGYTDKPNERPTHT